MRSRLTYSNVVASLALFVALGGVGYAAATLPADSVGTRQLRDEAVTLPKIADRAERLLARSNPRALLVNRVSPEPFTGAAKHHLRKVGPFEFSYACFFEDGVHINLDVAGPPNLTVQGWYAATQDDGSLSPVGTFGRESGTAFQHANADGGKFQRTVGAADVRVGSRNAHVDFNLLADDRGGDPITGKGGHCSVYGAAYLEK